MAKEKLAEEEGEGEEVYYLDEGDDLIVDDDEEYGEEYDEEFDEECSGADEDGEDMASGPFAADAAASSGLDESDPSAQSPHFNFNVHHGQPIYSLDWFDNATAGDEAAGWLVSGGGDDRACLLDVKTCSLMADFGDAGDSIAQVRFDEHERNRLAIVCMNGSIRVVNFKSGQLEELTLEGGEGECLGVNWHPRGPLLLATFTDGSTWLWNVADPNNPVMNVFNPTALEINNTGVAARFTPDGKYILIPTAGALSLYDPRDSERPLARMSLMKEDFEITSLACHPTHPILMVADAEGRLLVFKYADRGNLTPILDLKASFDENYSQDKSIEAIGFHPAGALAFAAGMNGQLQIFDFPSFRPRCKVLCGEGDGFVWGQWISTLINAPAFSSHALLLGTAQGKLLLVEGRTGEIIRKFKGRQGCPVLDAAVARDGQLAVAFDDGIISLYHLLQ